MDCELCLHLKAVWNNAIERPHDAIEAGQDAKMILEPGKFGGGESFGRHGLILDAVIGKQGRTAVTIQIHVIKKLLTMFGNGIAAVPHCFFVTR